MEYKICGIKGIEGKYYIYENGDIYSLASMKFLKHQILQGLYKYHRVGLTGKRYYKVWGIHILVALHFIGPKPPNCEINHKDMDKSNNHYTNLEWITHSKNMQHARQNKNWNSGIKPGFTRAQSTRDKMALKKHKKVLLYNDTEQFIYNSVEQFCNKNNIIRRRFNRLLNGYKTFNGMHIKFL
jgi:hypothetical protein